MKKTTIIIAAIIMMAGFTTKSMAQGVTTGNITAGAVIYTPIAITHTDGSGLYFGTLSVGASGGNCVLSTANVRTTTGDVNLGMTTESTVSNANFNVAGEGGQTYLVTFPTSITITAQGSSGGAPMTVDTWTVKCASAASDGFIGTIAALAPHNDTFKVGATLHVNANQASDAYSGTFNVTINYN